MRMMGRESVEYHRHTVIDRGDDYPGRVLAYYALRGETPLLWGGSGVDRLGLAGTVTGDEYEAIYGPGGARHPVSGKQLVAARRPGLELVISAHKSVAELGVIGRAEDMHRIMDAERDATLNYLDRVTRQMGGRRGRAAVPTATGGLMFAHTRHATSRAGDPNPHDHVLLANVVEMADEAGGWKAADTALWREHLHAATMVGRMASARVAVELGYGIVADSGPSGKLGHWRIAGIPDEVLAVHSKRAAEIEAECARRGESSYQARGMAARTTRSAKRSPGEADLVWHWQGELLDIGWEPKRLAASVDAAARRHGVPKRLTLKQARKMLSEMFGQDRDLARRKVFCRRDVIVAMAPYLYGQDPIFLEAMVDRALANPGSCPSGRGGRCPPAALFAGLCYCVGDGYRRHPGPPTRPQRRPGHLCRRSDGRHDRGGGRVGWSVVGGAGDGGRGDLHVGARHGDGGRGGRGGQNDHAAGGGRRLWTLRVSSGGDRHVRPGGQEPGDRSRAARVADVGQPALADRPRPAAP
jgi:conjugative relaxase-like TrwC/TraI family protein